MLKETRKIFNDQILEEALDKFGVLKASLNELDGFESFIYEYEKYSKKYILRITHSLHRNKEQIEAELDWILFLAKNGVSVSKPIHSNYCNYVEKISAGNSDFYVTSFYKAAGRHVKRSDISGELFMKLGKKLGKIHRLTKTYTPSFKHQTRPAWYDEIADPEKNLPAEQAVIKEKLYQIVDIIKDYPIEKDAYGMIHTDAHFGNIFFDESNDGQLTLFDFDDCSFQHFVSDIAIVIFYEVIFPPENQSREDYAKFILKNFMHGYNQENRLSSFWIEKIPAFLKLREILLYVVIHEGFDVENLDDPWCLQYLQGRRERIENDIPYLDMDFNLFCV